MDIQLESGTYVVAVSGGVDSMVLLDLLAQMQKKSATAEQATFQFIVAHYDHGIRENADFDRQLVQMMARQHGLQFVYDRGELGYGASEEAARNAGYDFLHKVRKAARAKAIVTAHHQDDLLETAMLNMMRGTGRRGLTSLKTTDTIIRPLLKVPKDDLISHAKARGLSWHEDVTNSDTRYRRNAIRHKVMPKVTPDHRRALLGHIERLHSLNQQIEESILHYLHLQTEARILDRQTFISLPHIVAREVMAGWLRHHGVNDYDKRTLERLVVAAKTLRPGQRTDVTRNKFLVIHKQKLALE